MQASSTRPSRAPIPISRVRCSAATRPAAYTYRPGTSKDGPIIQRTIVSQFMNPIGLNPNRFIIASSSDDPVVGFGQLVPHGSDTSELRSLFVKPEHRKKGIGRAIVEKLVARRGSAELYLLTSKESCPFYEACGFEALPPWSLPRFLVVDAALGSVVLALVERSTIVGMIYVGFDSSSKKTETTSWS